MSTLTLPPPLPASASARSPKQTAWVASLTFLLFAFPLLITGAVVPKFEEIFKDFGVALSTPTRAMIDIGHAASSFIGWFAIVSLLLAVILPISLWASRSPERATAVLLLALFTMFGYLVLLVIAMFSPLVTMIESLQAGGKV